MICEKAILQCKYTNSWNKSVVSLKKRYIRHRELSLWLHCKPATPSCFLCCTLFTISPISGGVKYLLFFLFCVFNRLIEISQMHHFIWKKKTFKKQGIKKAGLRCLGATRAACDRRHRTWATLRPHYAECLTLQWLYTSSASSRCCGTKQGFLPSHCMCMYYGSSTNQ